MAETNIKVLKIEVDTGTGEIKVNGVTKSVKEATAATKEFTSSAGKMKKSTEDLGSSAGIAGATVNELGRTISDLPYGITAISNNISQLGSLFAVLVSKVGSVKKAFESLMLTLRQSPALVALLAFQAAVATMDFLAQKAKKADKAVRGLNEAIGESATELKIAREILNDSNASLTRKEAILGQVNSKYKDLNITLGENKLTTQDSTNAINEKISSLERLAKSQAIVNEVSRIYGEMAILESKTAVESADTLDQINASAQNLANALQFILSAGVIGEYSGFYADKIEELGEKTRQAALEENKKTADALIKQLETLFIEKEPGTESLKKLEDLNILLIKAEIDYLDSIVEITEKGQLKKQKRITELQLFELDLVKKNALEKAKEEGRNGAELLAISDIYEKKRLALINDSNAKIMAIMRSFNTELKAETQTYADDKHLDAMLDTLLPPREQVKKRAKAVIDGLAAYQKNRQEVEENGNRAVAKLREEDMLAAIYAAQDLSNAAFGVMDASFQREIDLEQDKTNKINNELKERLANENLSADERRNIQKKIAANDEELRKKQEKIEEKKFKLNKAASIANATINTYLAATDALKQPGSTFQKIAAMIAIIGSGLAQVAIIAKQKFVSSQSGLSGTGAGGANGAGVQAPDFNIVGQSPSNQIAAAVQGQFQQPIKAYVVSKDVSTAQEMDRNIVGSATLG